MTTTARIRLTVLLAAFGATIPSALAQEGATIQVASRDMRGAAIPAVNPASVVHHDPGCPYAHTEQQAQTPAPAAPAEEVAVETAPAPVYAADPYGFAAIVNGFRAAAGLHPLAYDSSLSAWASQNNAAQCSRGIGHHINPSCFQNCGWNYTTAYEAATAWMNSPGHRQNMLSPSVTRFGIAYGPGPYWTLNAR
jgi:uncharacterized protein YkwD